LRGDAERKIQRLNEAQEEIDMETERFRWKKEEIINRTSAKEEYLQTRYSDFFTGFW
jgi:hypothetical protein